MSSFIRYVAIMALAGLAASGCRANMAPVMDVHNAPVVLPRSTPPAPAVVRDAIIRGLAEKTWTVDKELPRAIVASVSAGGHSATVQIDYDARYFSIRHVRSSPGLKYDGEMIHRRYNHWIKLLRAAIQKELAKAEPPG